MISTSFSTFVRQMFQRKAQRRGAMRSRPVALESLESRCLLTVLVNVGEGWEGMSTGNDSVGTGVIADVMAFSKHGEAGGHEHGGHEHGELEHGGHEHGGHEHGELEHGELEHGEHEFTPFDSSHPNGAVNVVVPYGQSGSIRSDHHANSGHNGDGTTHYLGDPGDGHHFRWRDQETGDADVDIYYDFRDDGGGNTITAAEIAASEAALDYWEVATGGRFNFIRNTSTARVNILNIGSTPMDGPGGALGNGGFSFVHDAQHTLNNAHAFQDSGENWDTAIGNGNPSGTVDYFTVVAQEIGHGIGLGHTNDLPSADIMDGNYGGEQYVYSPHDFAHIQGVYGNANLSSSDGGTIGSATVTNMGPGPDHFTIQTDIPPSNGLDVDMFSFIATTGAVLRVETDQPLNSSDPVDTYVRLFNSAGTQLANNDDAGNGLYSYLEFTIPTGGTYFVGVSGFANSSYDPISGSGGVSGSTGDFSLSMSLQALDSGDTMSSAISTGVGPVSGSSSNLGFAGDGQFVTRDVDMYQLTASMGSTLVVNTALPAGANNGADTILRLFDASGTQLAVNDDFSGLYSQITYTFPVSGTYYVGVSVFSNFSYDPAVGGSGTAGTPSRTGDYVLSLNLSAATDIGGTLGTAAGSGVGPMTSGFTTASYIGNGAFPTRDVDMFQINAAFGSILTVGTDAPSGTGDTVDTMLRLFDSAGNQLAIDDDSGPGLYSLITFTFGATGTYYVGVSGFANSGYDPNTAGSGTNGSNGDYTLDLSMVSPDVSDTLATAENTGVGILVPGGSFTKAGTSIGDSSTGNKDVDLYRFEATIGSTVTAGTDLPSGATSMDTMLRLFDSSGTQLAINDDSGPGLYSLLSFTLTATGTYYIGVSGFANSGYDPGISGSGIAGSTGDYLLNLTVVSPPDVDNTLAGALNTLLGPASGSYGNVAPVGDGPFGNKDVDMYAFNAYLGSTLTAATDLPTGGLSMDTMVRLFDSSGTALAIDDDSGPGFYSLLNYTFTAGGTYYVGVSGFANSGYDPNTGGTGTTGSTGDYLLDLTLVARELSINDMSVVEGNTGTVILSFTVTLAAASNQTVTVDYVTADGTATAPADYTAHPLTTLTFAPGETTKTVSVVVKGDLRNEANDTLFVILSNATNAVITDNQGVGTILNDDALPAISITDRSLTEGNTATKSFSFIVSLSAASDLPVTVNYATADGTATSGSDYVANSGTLTFSPGVISQTINVTVNGLTTPEADETFFVNLTSPGNAILLDSQGLGTILNDDANLIIDNVTVTEGDSGTVNAVFTVTLSAVMPSDVSVNYATANGSVPAATGGTDYVATSGRLTIPAGFTTGTITVLVVGDIRDDANAEKFVVNLTLPANAIISDTQGLGTITDDDAAPTLSISDVSLSEGNAGTKSFVYTVSLSAPSAQAVTVGYSTANDTAVSGSDYVAKTGTVTIAAGAITQSIIIVVNGDTTVEPDETFFVNLSPPANATIVDGQGLGTILNDDPNPIVSINDVKVTEGNAGTKLFTFTATLSAAAPPSGVTVQYATSDGTATAGSDYFSTTGTLIYASGQLTKTFTVVVSGETVVESDETFFVNLSSPTNATIGDGQGQGTILNDDANLTINNVTLTEGDSGTANATFTVTLSAVMPVNVSVNFATANGTAPVATAGTDYMTSSGTLIIPAGSTTGTITVLVIGDTRDEANEKFFVNLTNATNAIIADTQGLGTITDDDAAPSLSISDVSVAEGNGGTKIMTFTVTLSAASGQTVTVNYATADDTASAGSDYVGKTGTLSFAAGVVTRTITIVINGDVSVESDEKFFVNLSGALNSTLGDGQGLGTILNEDL